MRRDIGPKRYDRKSWIVEAVTPAATRGSTKALSRALSRRDTEVPCSARILSER
jgi:hypothetical protein